VAVDAGGHPYTLARTRCRDEDAVETAVDEVDG
jgi:hypothetical protein